MSRILTLALAAIAISFAHPAGVFADAGLPIIRINTRPGEVIVNDSAGTWTNMESFSLTDPNNPANNISRSNLPRDDRIRGRGNSTWNFPKKPYRIRFRENVSFFGLAAHENWILLAEWNDPTFVRNAFAFELGRRLNVPFTNTYHHVELYLNGDYQGVYVLTEHRQVDPRNEGAPGRVKIAQANGWFVEFDSRYDEDPKFRIGLPGAAPRDSIPIEIKVPETNYGFVIEDWHRLINLMWSPSFPESGYRDLIDMEAIVNFFLVQMITVNSDRSYSSIYWHKNAENRMSAGPLWDFDLTFGLSGLEQRGTFAEMYRNSLRWNPDTSDAYIGGFGGWNWPDRGFQGRFLRDPVFRVMWKERWNNNQDSIRTMSQWVDRMAAVLKPSADRTHQLWRPNETVSYNGWVDSLKRYLNTRLTFIDSVYNMVDILPEAGRTTFPIVTTGNRSEVPARTFTLVSYGQINGLENVLRRGGQSPFEVTTVATPTGNGGYLTTVNIKPRTALSMGMHRDTLVLRGRNHMNRNNFTYTIPLEFNETRTVPASLAFPTVAPITYDPARTLADVRLVGGQGDGTFAWVDSSIVPTVINSGYRVVFTPRNAANGFIERVVVTVAKADPAYNIPTGLAITRGKTLADIDLTAHSGWSWVDAHIVVDGAVGEPQIHKARFTPADTVNYNIVTDVDVAVMVEQVIAILSPERDVRPNEEIVIVVPVTVLAGEFTAGPNPVDRHSGSVSFYWNGRSIKGGTLFVYDASGNVVNRIVIGGNDGRITIRPYDSRRQIGVWDLTDNRGRPIPDGTYLIRGVLVGADGKRERVSVMVGVR